MSDRKVVLKIVTSLDEFATSPDLTHEWIFEWSGEDSASGTAARSTRPAFTRWAAAATRSCPHWAASDGPIATAMNEKPKPVFSRTLEKAGLGTGRDFRRGPGRWHRRLESSRRRRNGSAWAAARSPSCKRA